jgi:hypothetical protein
MPTKTLPGSSAPITSPSCDGVRLVHSVMTSTRSSTIAPRGSMTNPPASSRKGMGAPIVVAQ